MIFFDLYLFVQYNTINFAMKGYSNVNLNEKQKKSTKERKIKKITFKHWNNLKCALKPKLNVM